MHGFQDQRAKDSPEGLNESGQVIVEQALILPMVVFLILGIVQLSMIQHARINAEYAAFNAARAGIVYNGDPMMMRRAASLTVLPTVQRADNWGDVGRFYLDHAISEALFEFLDIQLPIQRVEVEILEPSDTSIFEGAYARHLNFKQIDFDDYRDAVAEANLLSIQVTHYYELRIPFANWMIQSMWFAHRLGDAVGWEGVEFTTQSDGGQSSYASAAQQAIGDPLQEVRWAAMARQANMYFVPIQTHYTMRMQSNLYKTYLE